ncbi:MAG: hypothetical protein P4L53_24455 [Candidatus Obscuribacterales bacterium]|nr:hypothetical protein [Candidatus Obscuribacterales bacterium]
MSVPSGSWSRLPFQYVDDYGHEFYIELNDYIEPEAHGKKHYKDIPVLKTSPLWTGRLAQRIVLYGQEFETIKKIDEKEFGRRGAAEERRAIKEKEAKALQNASGATVVIKLS